MAQFKNMKQEADKAIQELKNKLRAITYRKEKMGEKNNKGTAHLSDQAAL